MTLQPDGKIVAAGFANNGSNLDFAVVRYNADGSLDSSFGNGGKIVTNFGAGNDTINAVKIQADGKIVAAGSTTDTFALARYNTDGSPDASFGTDGKLTTSIGTGVSSAGAVLIQNDGRIVAVGYVYNISNDDFALVRYDTNGSLDSSFGTGGKQITDIGTGASLAQATAIQPDGKIVAAGNAVLSGKVNFALARYNNDGSFDSSFGNNGKIITQVGTGSSVIFALGIQQDSKIVAAGFASGGFSLARYNTDGSLDSSFGDGGKVITSIGTNSSEARALKIQPDGKIVVAGSASSIFALARYNTDGSLDNSFGNGGKVTTRITSDSSFVYALKIQTDGKIVAAGSGYDGSTSSINFALARFNTDGSLDSSFGDGGKIITQTGNTGGEARAMTIQLDGKIVAAGFTFVGGRNDFALIRYNTDGSLDSSFGDGGKVFTSAGTTSSRAYAVEIQADGKIVAAGFAYNGSNNDFALVRYNTDGSLDFSFGSTAQNPSGNSENNFNFAAGKANLSLAGSGKVIVDFGGTDDTANSLAIDGSGRIILAGAVGNLFGVARVAGTIAPTAANAEISGRVVARTGRGVAGVQLSLLNAQTNETKIVSTNGFGYFNFAGLPVGNLYIVTAKSKRFTFRQNTQTVQLFEDLAELTFIESEP